MTQATWQLLTTAPNVPAAHAVACLLEGNGVACQVRAESSLLGEGRPCSVMVEAALLYRAKRVLSEASFTDEELELLATGQHEGDDAKEQP
jgi:hypothetical protein